MSATLATASPSALRPSLVTALEELPRATHPPVGSIASTTSRDWSPVVVRGEPVEVPHRIYHPVPAGRRFADDTATGLAITCLYTRHADGLVRQAALRHVLDRAEQPWTVPFVLQLLGEHVVEICEDIELFAATRLEDCPGWAGNVREFRDENVDFVALTRQRAMSYWQCYHRHRYPSPASYPSLRAIALLMGGARGRR